MPLPPLETAGLVIFIDLTGKVLGIGNVFIVHQVVQLWRGVVVEHFVGEVLGHILVRAVHIVGELLSIGFLYVSVHHVV